MPDNSLKILAFNCSLKSAHSEDSSSTDVRLKQVLDAFAEEGATGEIIRAVDHDIKPGVLSDQGDGDAWPGLRRRVIDADTLVGGKGYKDLRETPDWLTKWNPMLASNAAHLARLLKRETYPGIEGGR